MNLILLEPNEVNPSGLAQLSDARAAHALTVLELVPGDDLRVGVVDGPRGSAVVESVQGATVTLRCRFDRQVPEQPMVDLLLALPRPKVMRRLWAQIAALGVGRVILTNATRVERHYFDTHWLTPERYRPLLLEGLQQARDTRLPRVSIHRRLKLLVEDHLDSLFDGDVRLLADPSAGTRAGAILRSGRAGRVLLAVGPEGGWTAFERSLFAAHGFAAVSIGPRTLRTDTACIALLAVIAEAIGDRPQIAEPGDRSPSLDR